MENGSPANNMHSAVYHGTVWHHRYSPMVHRFRYRIAWLWLDLDEMADVLQKSWLLSGNKWAPNSFRRGDHLGDPEQDLAAAVRKYVAEHEPSLEIGPIRLLTQLRHFGHYFSPLNLYYCYDLAGAKVEAVVAEVSNTPWNERHLYLLSAANRRNGELCFEHRKAFHVSPFLPMSLHYRWRLSAPADVLRVSLAVHNERDRQFVAGMRLQRSPLTGWNLFTGSIRYPVAGVQVLAAIHYQALRLWLKRCSFFPHPNR